MLTLNISAPDHSATYQDLRAVRLPAARGVWDVRPGHAEAFATLGSGTVTCVGKMGHEETFEVRGGACHVLRDTVTMIVS